jgi:hypothetical protein
VWRFVAKGDGCWEWTGAHHRRGYGTFGVGGRRTMLAHRFMYELLVGPIPDGLVLDHLCRNTSCVNPEHLEAVTQAENLRRAVRLPITHCKHGHEYDEANTAYNPAGARRCRECNRIRRRAQYRASKTRT